MKGGHIAAVEYLSQSDDIGLIAQSLELFEKKGLPYRAEGFEVWDGPRFVHRFPEDPRP